MYISRNFIKLGISLFAICCLLLGLSGLISSSPELLLCFFGCLTFLALLIPLLLQYKEFDLFEPIVLVSISVLIGVTARSFYYAYSWDEQVDWLLDWEPITLVNQYAIFVVLGFFCFSLGYISTKKRIAIEKISYFYKEKWSGQYLVIWSFLIFIISLIASIVFLQKTGFDFNDLSQISTKRYVETDSGYQVSGELRALFNMAQPAFIIMLVFMMATRKRWLSIYGLLLLALFSVSISIPFIVSNRSQVVVPIVAALMLGHYYKRLKFKHLITVFVLIVFLMSAMAGLRAFSRQIDDMALDIPDPISSIIGSANFVDIGRAAIVMDRVPEVVDYQYGSSYFLWLYAPIPRSIWPDKPELSLGPMMKRDIYGRRTRKGGYPVDLLSEAYINFGYAGIPAMMLLIGMFFRVFYNSFQPLLGVNKAATSFYVVSVWLLALEGIGKSFSTTVVRYGITILPLYLLVKLIQTRKRS